MNLVKFAGTQEPNPPRVLGAVICSALVSFLVRCHSLLVSDRECRMGLDFNTTSPREQVDALYLLPSLVYDHRLIGPHWERSNVIYRTRPRTTRGLN
jgi:hypothetical protein